MSYLSQIYSAVVDKLCSPFRYVYKQVKCFVYASLYLYQGKVDFNTAIRVTENGLWGFVIDDHITIEQFMALNQFAAYFIANKGVRQLIIDGHITIEQFIALDQSAAYVISNKGVQQFIIDGRITIAQFMALNERAASALANEGVQKFIIEGRITIEQFMALNERAASALANEGVRQFIIEGRITMTQLMALNEGAAYALANEGVRQFIIDGRITMKQLMALNENAAYALANEGVRQLIIDRRMTLIQLSWIVSYEQGLAISDPDTIARINAGQMNAVDFIVAPQHALQPGILNAYNQVQNTHTASVHQSVSESAKKLYDRYKDIIAGANLNNVIESLTKSVFEYAAPVIGKYNNRERDCLEPAKAGLKRLTAVDYTFTDASSGVSTLELLAMAFLVVKDKGEGIKALIYGLYEIERGYNIDKINKDDDASRAIHVCPGGTFNKIIEKLVGIDPDCSVVFVDQETVASKFRII